MNRYYYFQRWRISINEWVWSEKYFRKAKFLEQYSLEMKFLVDNDVQRK